MTAPKQILLSLINRVGQCLPKRLQRTLADSPFIFKLMGKLSRDEFREIGTPEGYRMMINPLFHSNLVKSGDLEGYEPALRQAIMKFTRPGSAAYDVGANVGVFALLFASLVSRDGMVYAFEPEQNNYDCMIRSISLNQLTNITFDRRAVSNSVSSQKFDRRGGAFSGRLVGNNAQYKPTDNIETVDTISIDYLVKAEGYRLPDIVKIDVEGNELMVLTGMQETLRRHNPVILCEIHTHLGDSGQDVFDFLRSYRYSITDIMGRDFDQSQPGALGERHIIATREESECFN